MTRYVLRILRNTIKYYMNIKKTVENIQEYYTIIFKCQAKY